MAFSVESQTSQARPKSETNNTTNHEQTKTFFNSSTSQSSQNHQSDCIVSETSSNSNERESRKSQRYNIDDPGASTSTGNNIRSGEGNQPGTGTGERTRKRTLPASSERNSNNDIVWREKLIAQLLLLSQENNDNSPSAYEGFGYVHVDEQHNHTDRDKYEAKPKNHTDQGANANADANKQQQQQRDRVQCASNSHYQNTLFTRVGTNTSASETGVAYGGAYSKLEEFGDGNPYRTVSSDWDCNIPTRTQLCTKNAPRTDDSSRYTDYGDGDANGPGFEHASVTDPGVNGWYPADRCRLAAVPPGYEWSNAYCYS